MVEKQVSKYLWSNAVLTTTYLINRMPSTPLGREIPLRRLYPNQEPFTLPRKVFGCVDFVQNHTPGLDKLALQALKCVFVGYSRIQKGYRCFHPPTRRYIVSTDVTFLESKSFFEAVEPVPVVESVPLPSLVPITPTEHDEFVQVKQ